MAFSGGGLHFSGESIAHTMYHRNFLWIAVLAVFFSACSHSGSSSEEAKEKEWGSEPETQNTSVTATDLKAVFPDRLGGMKRGETDASQVSFAGIEVGGVSVEYGDREKGLSIDLAKGSFIGFASSMIESSELRFEEESADGYDRTIELDGAKAIEEYDRKNGRQQLTVFFEDHILHLEGWGLKEGDLRKFYRSLNLEALRSKGRERPVQ